MRALEHVRRSTDASHVGVYRAFNAARYNVKCIYYGERDAHVLPDNALICRSFAVHARTCTTHLHAILSARKRAQACAYKRTLARRLTTLSRRYRDNRVIIACSLAAAKLIYTFIRSTSTIAFSTNEGINV